MQWSILIYLNLLFFHFTNCETEIMLTYEEFLGILQSFEEEQLKQPVLIHIKDSEYMQQAQQVFIPDDDEAPVIVADICIQFEEE